MAALGMIHVHEIKLPSIVTALQGAGISRIKIIAWRDLDDPEAGGSELHAHMIARYWADAGLDVTMRTSRIPGISEVQHRSGYRVVRRSGRYGVFLSNFIETLADERQPSRADALVEIWNGMPFFVPAATRRPHVTILHHVHDSMWNMVLPSPLASMGRMVEMKLAPKLYRSSRIVTLSESSRDDIVSKMGLPKGLIHVVPPGVDDIFATVGAAISRDSQVSCKAADPLVISVGRLVPVKRFDLFIRSLVEVRKRIPNVRGVIVGEGYDRPILERLIKRYGAEGFISLPGRIDNDSLIDLYRSAWVVVSTSEKEGWGMTITEAGACGTPSVVSDIPGHRDAVIDEVTGLLVPVDRAFSSAIIRILEDEMLRSTLAIGALKHSRTYSWEATAAAILGDVAVAAGITVP
jgi:glycosyltransferase involved in cell wall biosynthesis